MEYKITPAARRDLRKIALHGKQEYGEKKAIVYTETITNRIKTLAKGEPFFKVEYYKGKEIRRAHIKHHFIFLQMRENAIPALIAVLYERSDYERWLEKRIE